MCITLATVLATATVAADPPNVEFERYQLDNGIHIIIAHVPDAQRQSTFTLLPLHMGNDGPGRAQWSHLLEHHLIRSTDSAELAAPGIDINGETTHHAARLDTIALPEHWPEAIERHAKWLESRTFEAEIHAAELLMIHSEEQATAMGGWTHKFALSAWNQIVRHGKSHAQVHGDVARSNVDDVMQYAENHLPVDDSVWIATVGPIDIQQVKAEIEKHIGGIEPVGRPLPPKSREGDAPQHLRGTWDLPTRHVILWWRLPGNDAATAAAALAVGDAMQMRLMQDASVLRFARASAVHAIVPTPEGAYFIINASLHRNADTAAAAAELEKALLSLVALPGPVFAARQVPMRLYDPQLLTAQRAQAPAELAFTVEANWMLQGLVIEYVAGCSSENLKESLAALTQQDVAAFAEALNNQPHGTLILESAAVGDLQP